MTRSWSYHGIVLRVVDGDTAHVDLDMGLKHWQRDVALRIAHINAPETSTEAGKVAKAFAGELLKPGDAVEVESHAWDKYGRLLASVKLADGRDFAQAMVDGGHAVPYEGGKR